MTIARKLMGVTKAAGGGDVWTDPDLANASYDSVSFSVATEEASPSGLFFKPDGTKVYIVGYGGDEVNEYTLSTAWDITSASATNVLSVSAKDTAPRDVWFKDDGTELYVVGTTSVSVHQYSLSTAWDISSATFTQSFSVSTQDIFPRGLTFRTDGAIMYVSGTIGDQVYQYSLSTAWDISTASYASKSYAVGTSNPTGPRFSPDGTKLFTVDNSTDDVRSHTLTTAWDVSTASYDNISFSVGGQEALAQGLFFKSDGTKMYVVGAGNDTIYQYSTAAAAPAEWTDPDLANASYDSVSFSVAGEDGVPVGLFFKPDGLSLYVTGGANKNVFQYSLSTAWDLSTASYASLSASIASQVSAARGLQFSSDGTKMFVLDSTNDAVFQYSLSTAWDVSSASYDSVSLSVTFASNGSFCMSSDGLYLYTVDEADDVDQYTLSTAWDLSTATFTATKNDLFVADDTSPSGIFFSPTGDKVFICGYLSDVVAQGTLSSNFDITTASRDAVTFSVSGQETLPYGVFFKPDGSKMYVVGLGTDNIYQYSTS